MCTGTYYMNYMYTGTYYIPIKFFTFSYFFKPFLIFLNLFLFVYINVQIKRLIVAYLRFCRMFGSSRWIFVLGVLATSLSVSFAQANYPPPPPERLTGMNPCISKQTCHECIQTPHCAWCAAPVSLY